ncbi:hypothetical protein OSG_eHP20_00230 [environmental Halophage eHP-20]|nr:hypothetical protein OSG_eHP20_00230 [environmental Halophage eHP-20]
MNDQEKREYEQQLDDADLKAILLGIHSELTHIRRLLSEAEAQTERWKCHDCGEIAATEAEMISHGVQTHNAPPNMEPEFYGSKQ